MGPQNLPVFIDDQGGIVGLAAARVRFEWGFGSEDAGHSRGPTPVGHFSMKLIQFFDRDRCVGCSHVTTVPHSLRFRKTDDLDTTAGGIVEKTQDGFGIAVEVGRLACLRQGNVERIHPVVPWIVVCRVESTRKTQVA